MSAHVLMGCLLIVISLVGVSEVLGGVRRLLLPGTMFLGGAVLLIALMAIESIRSGLSVFAFSQHRFIALIFVVAGGLQGVGRYGSVAWLELLGAFSWATVGVALGLHEGGTEQDVLLHGVLAAALVLSGLVQLSVRLAQEEARAMRLLGYLLIVVAGLGLLFYDSATALGSAHDH